MSFSASQSAFAGFGVVRRHPMSFLVWSLLVLVFAALACGVLFLVSGPTLMEIFKTPGAKPPADINMRLMPGLLAMNPVIFALTAIVNAAVFRTVLRPEQKSFAYLRLGADELRLFAVSAITGAIAFAVQFLLSRLRNVLGGAPSGVLINAAVTLLYWCLYVWASVRVALWGPLAFAERRIDFARAWKLTARRFWPLLGMFLMVLAVSLGCLIGILLLATVVGVAAGAAMAASSHSAASLQAGSPALLAIFSAAGVVYLLGLALMIVLFAASFAAAYRGIAAPADQAEVFS